MVQNLKELNLNFSAQPAASHEDTFGVFCGALKNLKELKNFQLNLTSCNFTENRLIQLSKVLPNLEFLVLECSGSSEERISGKTVKKFVASLVGLKNLSLINLALRCKDIDEQCAKEIFASFWELKSLNYLRFASQVEYFDDPARTYFEEQRLQLSKKFYCTAI